MTSAASVAVGGALVAVVAGGIGFALGRASAPGPTVVERVELVERTPPLLGNPSPPAMGLPSTGPSVPAPGPAAPERSAAPAPTPSPPTDARRSHDAVRDLAESWRKRIHQIRSASEREEAMREVQVALENGDVLLFPAASQVLWGLQGIPYDRERFRPALLRGLGAADTHVRASAANGLAATGGQPGDVERVIAALPAGAPAHSEQMMARAAMHLNGGRVDGPVAALFVRVLDAGDREQARDVANLLRSRESSPDVHAAVERAWRRHAESRDSPGLWFHILAQMKPPSESLVRTMFHALGSSPPGSSWTLVTDALERHPVSDLSSLIARSAADLLDDTTDPRMHKELLEVLVVHAGTSELRVLEEFAANELVPDATRDLARRAVEAIRDRR